MTEGAACRMAESARVASVRVRDYLRSRVKVPPMGRRMSAVAQKGMPAKHPARRDIVKPGWGPLG